MSPNKKRMILDDHRRLGIELKAMRDRLVEITVRLGGVYQLNDRIVINADLAWRAIDELRSTLDNYLFANYPAIPGKELMTIYYPGKDQKVIDHERQAN
jgi:hypothetical protein